MKKDIKQLTDKEAQEILRYVYPNDNDNLYKGISFETDKNKEGNIKVSMQGRPVIGIKYHNGQDNCILHFDHSKVILWLYEHGYDIFNFLVYNSDFSEIEKDFENFSFAIVCLAKDIAPTSKSYTNWTLERVRNRLNKLIDEFFYKESNE